MRGSAPYSIGQRRGGGVASRSHDPPAAAESVHTARDCEPGEPLEVRPSRYPRPRWAAAAPARVTWPACRGSRPLIGPKSPGGLGATGPDLAPEREGALRASRQPGPGGPGLQWAAGTAPCPGQAVEKPGDLGTRLARPARHGTRPRVQPPALQTTGDVEARACKCTEG